MDMSSTEARPRLLLTGGATGLGRAIGEQARSEGFDVVVLDRVEAGDLLHVVVDLSDAHAAREATREAVGMLGGVDALVLCAGVNRPERFERQDFDEWASMIQVNLLGNAAVTRAVISDLKQASGRIVGIGSTASRRLTEGMSAYGTSKHAFTAFLHAVALEEMGQIGVSIVHPGVMETGFFDGRREEYVPPSSHRLDPDDVARAVLYCLAQPSHVVVRDMFVTDVSVRDWP